MSESHPFAEHRHEPEVLARLLDRRQVADAYAQYTIKKAGQYLGAGQRSMELALDYHGIPRRKRGEKPPGIRLNLTRSQLKRLVMRAYARSDRCPPGCPGRVRCLDPGSRCILELFK